MSPDLKGPMSKAVSTPLTAGATVGTSPGGVGVDQAVQEARWDYKYFSCNQQLYKVYTAYIFHCQKLLPSIQNILYNIRKIEVNDDLRKVLECKINYNPSRNIDWILDLII